MKIKTNNQPRAVLAWDDLTTEEQKEFGYYEGEGSFFRYKNLVYDLGEFMRIDANIAPHPEREGWEKWQGYAPHRHFSGILIRYASDCDQVIVGRYFC